MRNTIILTLGVAIFMCGCASNKKAAEAKKVFQRPWVGGAFETLHVPKPIREQGGQIGKHGLLINRLHADTPLAKAGLQEGDLILSTNGKNVRWERDLQRLVDQSASNPLPLILSRGNQITNIVVSPGIERFEKMNLFAFSLGLSTHFNVDVYPNPDFSLVALGHDTDHKRLDLRDPVSKFRAAEKSGQQEGWTGLRSDEGRKTWLGPFILEQRKMIVSQESAP